MHNIFVQELRMFMDEQEGKKRKPNYNNKGVYNKNFQSSSNYKYEENKGGDSGIWN